MFTYNSFPQAFRNQVFYILEDVLKIYHFDQELSVLIFSMISKIEVSLRVRLVETLLIHGDSLVLQDSSLFRDKKLYWQNMSTIASEIVRSNDVLA